MKALSVAKTFASGLVATAIGGFMVLPGGAAAAEKAPSFTGQAVAAGLTSAQATWLQSEVDRTMARTGGTQIAPNRIQLEGAVVNIALPGEQQPRTFGTAAAACSNSTAPYGYFCAYKNVNYTGSYIAMYRCGKYKLPGWVNNGSYLNNQTPGTRGFFLNQYDVLYEGSSAPDSGNPYNWNPIWSIVPC
ncbi:hypothetical protein OG474_39165 [Kribbella sp. NBC_01505]|uniref:hypothetical protein n=1 Tax=Kribbella sp. NBC_01505 TaxID=2903580 RepID=UPI00386AF828